MNSLLFWMMLVWLFYVAYTLGARRTAARTAAVTPKIPPEISSDKLASMESKLAPWMDITGRKAVGGMVQFEGSLRGQADDIFQKLREAFAGEKETPLLLEGNHHDVQVLLLPGEMAHPRATRPRWVIHGLLLAATLATTTWAVALHAA